MPPSVLKPANNGHAPLPVDPAILLRRETLAVNLLDLDRVDPTIRSLLLAGKVDVTSPPIWIDKTRFDEAAIPFTCDLLTAACIIDTLRGHDARAGDFPTRCYVRRVQAWEKIAGQERLAVVVGERAQLNPKLFPPAPLAATPQAPRRLV